MKKKHKYYTGLILEQDNTTMIKKEGVYKSLTSPAERFDPRVSTANYEYPVKTYNKDQYKEYLDKANKKSSIKT